MRDEGSGPLLAGVELGGTKCVCILARGPDDVRDEVRIPTGEPQATLEAIGQVLQGWRDTHDFGALGIASFGPLVIDRAAPDHGTFLDTPKPGWSGVGLRSRFADLGVPLAIETDVNAAALAEGRWGAAVGLDSFVYVTVGTGVGVGTIVGGRPVHGLGHSEAGHMRVPRLAGDAWPGICPFHGDCVEGLASGPAIAASMPGEDALPAAAVHALGMMVHNLVIAVTPRRIVMGGGVANGKPELVPAVRAVARESLAGYGATRLIADWNQFLVPPALGDRAGPLGAIALADLSLRGFANANKLAAGFPS